MAASKKSKTLEEDLDSILASRKLEEAQPEPDIKLPSFQKIIAFGILGFTLVLLILYMQIFNQSHGATKNFDYTAFDSLTVAKEVGAFDYDFAGASTREDIKSTYRGLSATDTFDDKNGGRVALSFELADDGKSYLISKTYINPVSGPYAISGETYPDQGLSIDQFNRLTLGDSITAQGGMPYAELVAQLGQPSETEVIVTSDYLIGETATLIAKYEGGISAEFTFLQVDSGPMLLLGKNASILGVKTGQDDLVLVTVDAQGQAVAEK